MSELQRFGFEADGEIYEVEVDSTGNDDSDDPFERMGVREDAIAKMQQARQLIRFYAINAVSAFKDFGAAEVEEVTLKFGLKMGGKAGIPYVTEGSTESNLEIQVKCKFPSVK
jgi:hypothetical protein